MRAHYLQHVPFEGLAGIEPWLRTAGYEITSTRFFKSAELPAPDEIDLLVIMGGPMSVNDEAEFPWLVAEKEFVRRAIEAGTPVLGVCLGAQLIASALGARVYPNRVKEIGWYPVQRVASAGDGALPLPPSLDVFHWHGETFDLPPGAVHLARSAGCENQAFQVGRSAVGLQFHLETTPDSARLLVEHCRSELMPGEFVQSEGEILAAGPEKYGAANAALAEILEYLTGR